MAKTKIPSVSGATQKERNDAWLAASRFKEMQPQLTAFARSVTGNGKVQVHATHLGPHSIGNKIFIRPPLALGRAYPHDRSVCGRRGDDGRQECAACRVREVVDFYLYHEIGHIWCGTQDRVKVSDRNLFETLIQMWHPEDACSHGEELIAAGRKWDEVMPLANTFNKYLGMIFNALEDSRVNEGMFDARPGLRRTFEVNVDRMMSEGMELEETGESLTWHEHPADAQFIVGLSTLASDYLPDGYFHPDIIAALADPRVIDITSRARHAASVHEVFELAVRALFVANAMGFCIIPKCEVPSLNNEPEDPDAGTEPRDTGQPVEPPGESGASAPSDPGADSVPQSDGSGSGGTEGPPEERKVDEPQADSDSKGSRSDDNGDSPTGADGSGAPSQPDPADDAEADAADTASGSGPSGEGDPSGRGEGSDESESSGIPTGGSSKPEEQGGSPGSDSSGSGSPGSTLPVEEDIHEPPGQGAVDPTTHGDGDSSGPKEGSDGQDGTEDSDADGEVEPDPQDDNADPWAIAAPSETGSDDDPMPLHGTVEDAERALAPFLMHGTEEYDGMLEDMLGEALADALLDVEEGTTEFVNGQPLILVAISQVAYFDDPSASVAGVETITFPCEQIDWVEVEGESYTDYSPSEMHVGAAVLHARRVFQENKLAKLDRNQRSGKVNTRVLARRAPVGDDRLFGRKTRPKRRDHLVIITGDCSGSTQSFGRSEKIRRMMMAQGDILHRVGVPFIMLGHSAARAQVKNFSGYSSGDYWTYALMVKDLNEGWGPITKNRLAALGPIAENLDGHTLEYCRKLADKSNATDVVIIYYTDGEMPAANATEEREVLVREVKTCKNKGYHLLGVGINTDSPKRYGMKTVRVDSDADIRLVVEQLEKELTQ